MNSEHTMKHLKNEIEKYDDDFSYSSKYNALVICDIIFGGGLTVEYDEDELIRIRNFVLLLKNTEETLYSCMRKDWLMFDKIAEYFENLGFDWFDDCKKMNGMNLFDFNKKLCEMFKIEKSINDDCFLVDYAFNCNVNYIDYEKTLRYQQLNKKQSFSKKIHCPICRDYYILTDETIRIKGQMQDCCICQMDKAEILCNKCKAVHICFDCANKL